MFLGVVPGLSVADCTRAFCSDTPTAEPTPEATLPPVPVRTTPPSDSTVDCDRDGPNTEIPVAPTFALAVPLFAVPPVPVMVSRPIVDTSLPTVSTVLPMITPTALPPDVPAPLPPVPVIETLV